MTPFDNLLGLHLPSEDHPHIGWRGLHGAAGSLAVAEACAAWQGSVCIIAPSAGAVEQLERELEFFAGAHGTFHFPDYETLPYERMSPPKDLLAGRLSALHRLAEAKPLKLVVNADALLTRLPPKDFILSRSLQLARGETLERDALLARLSAHGYFRVDQVNEPGEFAVRGALIDLFATGSDRPVRIDLFDDEIESLRPFDPTTQLSEGEIETLEVLPAREFPFDTDAITGFRQRFRDRFSVEPGRSPIYRDISEAQLPAGIEYYLPLFFDTTCSLFDYLPGDALIVLIEGALDGIATGWDLVTSRHEQLSGDAEYPLLPPAEAFNPPEKLIAQIRKCRSIDVGSREHGGEDLPIERANTGHALGGSVVVDPDRISRWIDSAPNERTLVVASSPGRREVLLELLRGRGYAAEAAASWQAFASGTIALGVGVGELRQGLKLPDLDLRVITAAEIGLERPRQRVRRRRMRDADAIISELTDLRPGTPVVHEDYGVGRYQGLATLDVDGLQTEFLLLEYAGGDKLYVPVLSLHLVTRFTGASAEEAPLHRLGSDQWDKAKRKAAQKARDVAAELLNLYAQRAARTGARIESSDTYAQFAAQFPFEETDDQLSTIEQVLADMASERPMDRIVCGDVGFGKTEVALRASFVAAHAGFQVAVLVPTTLLAQQHYQTFSDRFADWPVEVELLSRFRSAKESRGVLDGIASGTVDIVIGTHKLLSSSIRFKRLGLVVVDEEHRFGVKHKEQLKRLRAEVDMLTMTATPIPRTLNMTLGGLRDLSVIATPPAERLSVRTFVGEWNDQSIRDAVLREIRRGGQVYFVHNRVENIEGVAEQLRKLISETEIRVAHGQMSERALESVMLDFYHRRFGVLVTTAIIESGIDVPNANTIIINRADHLGLAQLHQLRGRVGRSHHQAYAYLLAPPTKALTPDAAKRLDAIAALEALGSGFALATHDLEIRGAGELLGDEQSGQIQAIGFTLYNELLARAVAELREGREPDLEDPFTKGPEIEVGLPALIPADYMPDVHMRLVQYKRIANAASQAELDDLQVEMINRFGLLPDPIKTLFAITWLKLLAQKLNVAKLQASSKGGSVRFAERAAVDPVALVTLIEREPQIYSLDGPYKLRFKWQTPIDDDARVAALEKLLARLGAKARMTEAA